MLIGIIGWALCGVVLGLIAGKFVNLHGDDPRIGIVIAVAGGVVGGWLYTLISGSGVSYFNVWSLLCATVLAGVSVAVWHFIRARGTYEQPSIRRTY